MTDLLGTPPAKIDVRRRRSELASIFTAFLIGLAFQEFVAAFRPSLSTGIRFETTCLAVIFFFTSVRFLIGAHLHVTSEHLTATGYLWMFDLLVITLEMLIIIMMGSSASFDPNATPQSQFVVLLAILLAIDVAWVIAQWVSGRVSARCRRAIIPWPWAAINLGLLGIIAGAAAISPTVYAPAAIGAVALANVAAFVLDVLAVDHYGLL